MSHFTCMLILPRPPEDREDLMGLLSDLLAPFDENVEVEPYKKYVAPAPEGWEASIANGRRFEELMDAGVERKDAWRQVWGERNDDPDLPIERSSAARAGLDPNDNAAVAKHVRSEWNEEYLVDAQGLFRWSTYNPQSQWDWWSLGGRWMGYFQAHSAADAYLGRPGTFDNDAPTALGSKPADACAKGDIDVDGMQLAKAAELGEGYDEAFRRHPDGTLHQVAYDIQPGESREAYIVRKADPAALLKPYAVLAEGVWRDAGKMRWFGCSDSTEDSREKHAEWFARFWQGMPDETWVAVCDLHI